MYEATQLLKTLRVPAVNPRLKVMQLAGWENVENDFILLDSGATHCLRPAVDDDEWIKAERTTVQLADGSTDMFRLKYGTKVLLSEPGRTTACIIPMGGLAELDFTLEWSGDVCRLRDDENREIPVELRNGCPMVSNVEGRKLLNWLEHFQIHQARKLAIVKTMMMDENIWWTKVG